MWNARTGHSSLETNVLLLINCRIRSGHSKLNLRVSTVQLGSHNSDKVTLICLLPLSEPCRLFLLALSDISQEMFFVCKEDLLQR